MKINLVLPMGGIGQRFRDKQFNIPKPLIEIYRRPFFYWAARCIEKYADVVTLTFIILKAHDGQFNLSDKIYSFFPNAHVVTLDKLRNGPVFSCLESIPFLDSKYPVVFQDCDHVFLANALWTQDNTTHNKESFNDGIILTFQSKDPSFGYCITDDQGNVLQTKEKKVISNDAICGAYFFSRVTDFKQYSEKLIQTHKEKKREGELFLSDIIRIMIEENKNIKRVKTTFHLSFGTPERYRQAALSSIFNQLV
jgi:dTDP-glucose pyrophosphorylase